MKKTKLKKTQQNKTNTLNNINLCINIFKYCFNTLYYDFKRMIMWLVQSLSCVSFVQYLIFLD